MSDSDKKISVAGDGSKAAATAATRRPENDIFSESSTLQDRLGHFFDESLGTDVKFVVGSGDDQVVVLAHKVVLAASSPVFYSMFYGDLESDKEMSVPDCDPEAFKVFIRMFYTFSIPMEYKMDLMNNKISELFYIARKYLFRPLEKECIDYCRHQISPDLVFKMLDLAELYMIPELTAICFEFLNTNLPEVFDMHRDKITLKMLCTMLEDDKLEVEEVNLFSMLMRWAEFNFTKNGYERTPENYNLVAGPAFKLIRYTTMKSIDIADLVVPSGILTSAQIARIFTYIHGSRSSTGPIYTEFNTKNRVGPPKLIELVPGYPEMLRDSDSEESD